MSVLNSVTFSTTGFTVSQLGVQIGSEISKDGLNVVRVGANGLYGCSYFGQPCWVGSVNGLATSELGIGWSPCGVYVEYDPSKAKNGLFLASIDTLDGVFVDSTNYIDVPNSTAAHYNDTAGVISKSGSLMSVGGVQISDTTAASYAYSAGVSQESIASVVLQGGLLARNHSIMGQITSMSASDVTDAVPSVNTAGGMVIGKNLWVGGAVPPQPGGWKPGATFCSWDANDSADRAMYTFCNGETASTGYLSPINLVLTKYPGIVMKGLTLPSSAWGTFTPDGIPLTSVNGTAGYRTTDVNNSSTLFNGTMELYGSESATPTYPVAVSALCPMYTPAYRNTPTGSPALLASMNTQIIQRIEQTPGFPLVPLTKYVQDSGAIRREATVTTQTGRTSASLVKIVTDTDYMTSVKAVVVWVSTDKSIYGVCSLEQRCINSSGTVSLYNPHRSYVDPVDSPVIDPLSLTISGVNVLVTVTGSSTKTIRWSGYVTARYAEAFVPVLYP